MHLTNSDDQCQYQFEIDIFSENKYDWILHTQNEKVYFAIKNKYFIYLKQFIQIV